MMQKGVTVAAVTPFNMRKMAIRRVSVSGYGLSLKVEI
jgi:hypothetical protein